MESGRDGKESPATRRMAYQIVNNNTPKASRVTEIGRARIGRVISAPAARRWSEKGRGIRSFDGQCDLAHLLTSLQTPLGVGGLGQGVSAVDDRVQLAFEDQLHHLAEVRDCAHR